MWLESLGEGKPSPPVRRETHPHCGRGNDNNTKEKNMKIDWVLLREQKMTLLRLASKAKGIEAEHLEGVIEMIHDIQEKAFERGEPVVWIEETN